MVSQKVVTPVKAGVQEFRNYLNMLESGFRRSDKKGCFPTFYEGVKDQYFVFNLTISSQVN